MTRKSTQKIVRLDDTLAADIKAIAEELHSSENQVILAALKLYRDHHYMTAKATFINEELLNILQASYKMAENTINNKTNRVLSEMAIQCCIQNQILAKSLQISTGDLNTFRLRAVDYLKDNQRVMKMDEIVD